MTSVLKDEFMTLIYLITKVKEKKKKVKQGKDRLRNQSFKRLAKNADWILDLILYIMRTGLLGIVWRRVK